MHLLIENIPFFNFTCHKTKYFFSNKELEHKYAFYKTKKAGKIPARS